jgi:pyruvate-formate lyase-activating enzyme
VLEVSRLCKEKGIVTFLNTNGFINTQIAERLAEAVDYPVVGIKGSASPSLYGKLGANPQAILDALKVFCNKNPRTWITDMDGPGLQATDEDHQRFGAWVHDNIGPRLEIHVGYLLESTPTYQAGYMPIGGPWQAHHWMLHVALKFAIADLTNVWIPTGNFELMHIPSGRRKPGIM